jgi:hypothetical protein
MAILAMKLRVGGSVYFAHTALAELSGDLVVRDGFADHFFKRPSSAPQSTEAEMSSGRRSWPTKSASHPR